MKRSGPNVIEGAAGACGAEAFAAANLKEVRQFIKYEQELSFERLVFSPGGVLVMLFPYHLARLFEGEKNVSAYDAIPDYHEVVKERLRRGEEFLKTRGIEARGYCDVSPFFEKPLAAHLKLGTVGEHTLLISPGYGTFFFIGELVYSEELGAYPPKNPAKDECSHCGRCRGVCPTGALSEGGFCRAKCLSHLALKKSDPTPEERGLLRRSNSIWGCDLCQIACPPNENLPDNALPEFQRDIKLFYSEEDFSDEEEFNRRYGKYPHFYKGYRVLRRNFEILRGAGTEKE